MMMEMLPLTELWLSSLLAVGILFYLIYACLLYTSDAADE